MSWNTVPDDLKKDIIKISGGFKAYHYALFKNPIAGIELCSSIKICYVCGLSSVWMREPLKRNPSTKLYIKNDGGEIAEVFGKCKKHINNVPTDSVSLPLNIETEDHIIKHIRNHFPEKKQIFLFHTEEGIRSGWKIINMIEPRRLSVSSAR